jgi:hypothetical protein
MKFIKLLPVFLLTGVLSFAAFAGEDQNNQLEGQVQSSQQNNLQVAVADENVENQDAKMATDQKSKTTKASHKRYKCNKCQTMQKAKNKADQPATDANAELPSQN